MFNHRPFLEIISIFIGLFISVFSGWFAGTATAGESVFSEAVLPILDIKIDGQEQDWAAVNPQLVDLPGDSMVFTHTGVDILSCTLATNPKSDILFIRVKVMGGPNFEHNLVQYMMGFDDPAMNSTGTLPYEWLISIDSYNQFSIRDLRGKNRVDDQNHLSTWSSSENKISRYAQGDVIEYSLPFSVFQGMETFKIELFLKLRDRDNTCTDQVSSEIHFIKKKCADK